MESNYSEFVLAESIERIEELLKGAEENYQDSENIPTRDKLTFDNGYNVSCSVVFIDMRGSKTLAEKYKKTTLAKIYRAYTSELVAVLKDDPKIQEISIEGDCVWGVFDTQTKQDVDRVFTTAAKAASLIDILNYKFSENGLPQIKAGIGMSDGNILMIKAGYKNSGINEVAWVGDMVGEAARLCSYGNKTPSDARMMISRLFYQNLNKRNQGYFKENVARDCYHGNVINVAMSEWLKAQG